MSVRLFGYDVEITASFWFSSVMLALLSGRRNPLEIAVWVIIVLVSILLHEFGHALAFRAFGVRSSIRLHFMGGVTIPNVVLPLSRKADAIVSFAGPLAGFFLGGITWLVMVQLYGDLGGLAAAHAMRKPEAILIADLLFINIGWGIVNLMPVLPLDGGHILEAALGPKRYRITLGVSAAAGAGLAILFGTVGMFFATYIFGSAALQSFLRLREVNEAIRESSAALRRRESAPPGPDPLHPNVERALRDARRALDDERFGDAIRSATEVIEGKVPDAGRPTPRAVADALSVLAWAQLAEGRPDEAAQTVVRLSRTTTADPALVGSVALARGEIDRARSVLEGARARGDDRKEVYAPLIQVLVRQGDLPRAAGIAIDSFDGISTEDARTLAGLANDAGAFPWAGKLFEAAFGRERQAEDAFEAARSFARGGDGERALELLKSAVSAGFSDAGRAHRDDALGKLDIDRIIPRPG